MSPSNFEPVRSWNEVQPGLSTALLEMFLRASTPLTLFIGPEHRFSFINDGYVRLTRRSSADELLGKPVREALPELAGQGFFELLDQVYSTGESYVGHEVPGMPGNQEIGASEQAYFNFVYQPIRSLGGSVIGIAGQASDVTEQVRARRESEQREQILHRQWSELESIYRTAPVGLALIHPVTLEFLRANDVQSQMNGIPAEEMIGKSVRAIAPDVADEVEKLFRSVVAGHAVRDMEIGGELPHQPGVHHDWIVNYFPIYAEDGTVDAVSCVTLEVTAQKRAEAALRVSESRFRAMYSASLEYIGLLSPDGSIIDCNRAALAFADTRREDVLGVHFADAPWFQFTPGGPELCRQAIARACSGEQVHLELPLIRPSGETIVFDFSLSPVYNEQGEVEFLVPEGRDITDLKRTQAALIQSEKLAAVGRMASSVAHEINNPLEAITNLIYLARQKASLPDVQQMLDAADAELRRVSVIANQTLRFHKQASNPQATTCAELFASALRIYESRMRNQHIHLEHQKRAREPVVCFEGDIRQVLLNVVGNAIDAMPLGGRLLLRSRPGTDWRTGRAGVLLSVADTGMGIDPAVRSRIFEPFFTTKGYSGTGLGLWICREIMDRHQGSIWIRSRQLTQPSGTVVLLFLPFKSSEVTGVSSGPLVMQ